LKVLFWPLHSQVRIPKDPRKPLKPVCIQSFLTMPFLLKTTPSRICDQLLMPTTMKKVVYIVSELNNFFVVLVFQMNDTNVCEYDFADAVQFIFAIPEIEGVFVFFLEVVPRIFGSEILVDSGVDFQGLLIISKLMDQ